MNWKLTLDLLVIAAYFAVILGIGIYFSRGNRDVKEFTLGGRSIPWWAVLASILASEISAGTFFGSPGQGYDMRNYTYALMLIGYLLARVVVSAVFVPAYYRHNVVSIYEFLETRFGPRTRRIGSAVFLVTRALASGSRLWVPTILVVILWNLMNPENPLNGWGQFWVCGLAMMIISLFTAFYTALGGIKAVIWTDVIQIAVLFAALGFSLWYLLGHIPGGWDGANSHLTGEKDLILFTWQGDAPGATWWDQVKSVLATKYTLWVAFFGSLFITLATHGTDQDMVQRMLTAKDKTQSAKATILSGLADIPIVFATLTIGILLWVYYNKVAADLRPISALTGKTESDQVFPHFVLTIMPAGLRGLVIAGVLATTMGSLGTALNSLATSYCRDFHFRWFKTPEDEMSRVRLIKKATFWFALALIAVGLGTAMVKALNPSLTIIPIILGSFSYTYGSLLGIFLVGLFTKTRGNDTGNWIAMLSGFIAVAVLSNLPTTLIRMFWAECPELRPSWLPVIEFSWMIMFGTIVTFCIALCFRTCPRSVARHQSV